MKKIRFAHCTFDNNYTTRTGGAIYTASGASVTFTMTDCNFYGNYGATGGGAMRVDTGDIVTTTNSTFIPTMAQLQR